MSESATKNHVLLYRPTAHLKWIVRNWRQRPCVLIVLRVVAHALLALLSITCWPTLITQPQMYEGTTDSVWYWDASGDPHHAACNALPPGYIESCRKVRPTDPRICKALDAFTESNFVSARHRGFWRHVINTIVWCLTCGCARKRRRPGFGVELSRVFPENAYWTSASLLAFGFTLSGVDVSMVYGNPTRHWRPADFLLLERVVFAEQTTRPTSEQESSHGVGADDKMN